MIYFLLILTADKTIATELGYLKDERTNEYLSVETTYKQFSNGVQTERWLKANAVGAHLDDNKAIFEKWTFSDSSIAFRRSSSQFFLTIAPFSAVVKEIDDHITADSVFVPALRERGHCQCSHLDTNCFALYNKANQAYLSRYGNVFQAIRTSPNNPPTVFAFELISNMASTSESKPGNCLNLL